MQHAPIQKPRPMRKPPHLFPPLFLRRCHHRAPPTPGLPPQLHLFLSNPPATLPSLLQTHAQLTTSGLSANPFFASKLISLYASFRRPDLASHVFDAAPRPPDTFLWSSVIKSHFDNGDYRESLRLYRRMHGLGALPDHFTVPMVVSSCAGVRDPLLGFSVHGVSVKCGLFCGDSGVGVGSSFVYFYSKTGRTNDASNVFDEMPKRDVVAWTALIVGLVTNGECEHGLSFFLEMLRNGGARPNSRTVEVVLQACGNLEALPAGKCLHGFSMKTGCFCCQFVNSSLLLFYSRCGDPQEAALAFHGLPEKDIVSWTAIVGCHARKGLVVECLNLFQSMLVSGVEPDDVYASCLLMTFAGSGNIYGGKAFHAVILRRNVDFNAAVVNSLLSMYCKLELRDNAETVFNMTGDGKRDVESWNLLVIGYGRMGLTLECLDLFRRMQCLVDLYLRPSTDCLLSVISSCSQLRELTLGKSIHCYAIKTEDDVCSSVLNSLINMYGHCRKLDFAQRMFDHMEKDLVSWNTLISVYCHLGRFEEALVLSDKLFLGNLRPNVTSLKIVLSACSNMAALHQGERIHDYIKEQGLQHDLVLSTGLVDMYAKCGQLKRSREIFDSMLEKDAVSWNVMISGYGSHGHANEALGVFNKMEEVGAKPSEITFLALLTACSHAGLVEEGRNLFNKMRTFYSLIPTCKHYTCMVDLLGRSGRLDEAENLIIQMPVPPDGAVWGALLGACNMHNDVERGERAAKRTFELDHTNDGYYILMANLYESAGRWQDADEIREMMKNSKVAKKAGWSATELNDAE